MVRWSSPYQASWASSSCGSHHRFAEHGPVPRVRRESFSRRPVRLRRAAGPNEIRSKNRREVRSIGPLEVIRFALQRRQIPGVFHVVHRPLCCGETWWNCISGRAPALASHSSGHAQSAGAPRGDLPDSSTPRAGRVCSSSGTERCHFIVRSAIRIWPRNWISRITP